MSDKALKLEGPIVPLHGQLTVFGTTVVRMTDKKQRDRYMLLNPSARVVRIKRRIYVELTS